MGIYIFNTEIEILEARMIPVWIEVGPGRIRWHYGPPRRIPKKAKVDIMPVWHIKAKWKDGELLHQGRWRNLTGVNADGGISEIYDRCKELAPLEAGKFEQWNKTDGPEATVLFEPVAEKMVA